MNSLAGRRVLVTRPREQAAELVAALEAAGAEVVVIPTIAILPAADPAPLEQALAARETYAWVAFTSLHAVRFAYRHASPGPWPRLAAVGGRTALEVANQGGVCELVGEPATAEALAQALIARGVAGARVLFPRGDRARETLPAMLRAAGAVVDEPVAYRTVGGVDEEGRARLTETLARGLDWAVLTSPSTWHELVGACGPEALAGVRLAAMGPTTAAALRAAGREPAALPPEPGLAALVRAMQEA